MRGLIADPPGVGGRELFWDLKAPAVANALPMLADPARADPQSYEHFAAGLLLSADF